MLPANPILKIASSVPLLVIFILVKSPAKEINPKQCFPIHDGILKSPGASHTIPPPILESVGIKFIVLEIDKEVEV